MPKKGRQVRSARGVMVDFDLMEIKNQMANQPKSTEVKAREDFIEQRLRRRAKRRAERIAQQTAAVDVDAKVEDAPEQEAPFVERKVPAPKVSEETKQKIKKSDEAKEKLHPETKTRRIIKKKTEDK